MTNEHFEPIFNAAEATQVVFQQPASEPIELHIPIDPSSQETLALAVLQQASSLSRAQLKDAMSKGAVWAQKGKRTAPLRRHKQSCQGIEQLHLYYNAKVLAEQPGALKKLHGEKDFSVWLKPRGMRSHGSRWGDHCSVLRQGELQLERSCYIVHRLDSAASGLILLAHNKAAARHLSEAFAERKVDKRYRIRVQGHCEFEQLSIEEPLDGKACHSKLQLIEKLDDGSSRLEVKIGSGRKHQIRRHCAHIGHPVLGDRLYGNASEGDIDLQLCAFYLGFKDLAGEWRVFEINLAGHLDSNQTKS